METLARAMHAAHEQDVIHRDLKPANVLLTRGRHAQDHRLRPGQEDSTRRARRPAGAIMGTPVYMAPEQAGGKSKEHRPGQRRLRAGGDPLRTADGPAAVQGGHAAGHVLQVVSDEPVPPRQLQPQDAARPGNHLPEMSAQGAGRALCDGLDLAEDLRRFQAASRSRPGRWAGWSRLAVPAQPAVAACAGVALTLILGARWPAISATKPAAQADRAETEAGGKELQASRAEARAEEPAARRSGRTRPPSSARCRGQPAWQVLGGTEVGRAGAARIGSRQRG